MEGNLKKKYGLFVAMAMVVGIVIGSGVFFKAETVLVATGGNLPLGILAWVIGGCIMLSCAATFAVMATRYEKVNGLVDYAEVTCGSKYAYLLGWFMTCMYYPSLTGVLAWVSARYVGVLFGISNVAGGEVMVIAGFFLIASYAMNALSPKLAGKFQVSTTVIKLIPLLLMGIVGLIVGLSNGMTMENFTTVVDETVSTGSGLMRAVVATAFAYEGWIIATTINSELRNAKRNLPLALLMGTAVIAIVYIVYYIGLAGAVTNAEMMAGGAAGAQTAFTAIFGSFFGSLLMVFVVISCLGTLNGLMMGCTRGLYSLAARNVGPKPEMFKQIDKETNMPTNSSVIGLLLAGFWMFYFFGSQLVVWFGEFGFDNSELPIVVLYLMYIPIFVQMMRKEKGLSVVKRFILPVLSIVSCCFMVYASIVAHKWDNLYFLIVFAVVLFIGILFMNRKPKVLNEEENKNV